MAFKLLLAAEEHWRRLNAPHLVALVKAGVKFTDGEAEMFQSEPTQEEMFSQNPSILAADPLAIHNI